MKDDWDRKDEETGVHPAPFDDDQALLLPQMSYTAVMSGREMAGNFLRYLLAAASKMIPRQWTAQDLQDILTFVIEGGESPVQFIEARYLRRRIQDQIVRAERYKEPFSLLVIRGSAMTDDDVYGSLVDLLAERLRKTDMVFSYRQKIAVLLPHTSADGCRMLVERIRSLATASEIVGASDLRYASSSHPSGEVESPYDMLDWIEDQLR